MRGRRGGKTGSQNPPRRWPNAAGASPCCGALLWRAGEGQRLVFVVLRCSRCFEMGPLRQCPGVRLGPGADSLATRGRSRRRGVGGAGPLAPGTGHKPALFPEEHPRLKAQPNHVPSVRSTWGPFFSVTKTVPSSGLFEGGKSPSPPPPPPTTTPPAPTCTATHPKLPSSPPRLIWAQPAAPGATQVVPSTGPHTWVHAWGHVGQIRKITKTC
jgi:hypothetical protein